MNFPGLGKYVVNRLREPSTWAGIAALAVAGGAHITSDEIAAIATAGPDVVTAGMSVAAMLAIFLGEKKS